jgi:Xaa-Pro dipeptidase
MHEEPFVDRCSRAGTAAHALGAAAILASDPGTVRWLTGRQAEIEFGPPYPIWAGTHVLLDDIGRGTIICPSDETDLGPPIDGVSVEAYEAYTLGPLQPMRNVYAILARLLKNLGDRAPLAVEPAAVSVAILGSRPWIDATETLRWLRVRKDPSEVDRIARTAAVVSVGQRAFRAMAAVGSREIDVFSEVHAAMQREAGTRVPVLPDVLSGPRMAEIGRPPTGRFMQTDELALCDLAARLDGYWADSCTTICLGTPTDEMKRLHDVVRRALDAAIERARPGIVAGELDHFVRAMLADSGYRYPHHSGHGVGVGYHEEPRIVPGSSAMLEDGMVIALEPAGFGNGIGARIEQVVAVSATGPRILTDYETRLER